MITKATDNIYFYFKAKLGREPSDTSLIELPVLSACGEDCARAIDACAAFRECTHEAGASEFDDYIIQACNRTVEIFWRG